MSPRVTAQLVDKRDDWHALAPRLAQAGRLAVDLEADGFHRYPERVALIQLALGDGTTVLVDPLSIDDLAPFGAILSNRDAEKVLHSADYDVRSLDRDFDYSIAGLFDTAIAAQFCGSERTGLANVLSEYLEIDIPKPKRLQRLDWSQRPLPADALEYAAGDVAHLLELRDVLARRLEELGRTSWVAEECERQERVRYAPPEPPEVAYLSIRGARKLSGRSLAVLRELYVFREREALAAGLPPYRVMTDQALTNLAQNPTTQPDKVKGIRRSTLAGAEPRLEGALRRGIASDPVVLPRSRGRNPWTPETRRRLSKLKLWRNDQAERLQLDRGVVWPAGHLNQVALHPGTPSLDLDASDQPLVRRWQWQVLGPDLDGFRRAALGDKI